MTVAKMSWIFQGLVLSYHVKSKLAQDALHALLHVRHVSSMVEIGCTEEQAQWHTQWEERLVSDRRNCVRFPRATVPREPPLPKRRENLLHDSPQGD